MFENDIDNLLKELAVSKIWSDDFACAIKTEDDLRIIKEAANLKDKHGNRLYDNFQLFQFLGCEDNIKAVLVEKFCADTFDFLNINNPLNVIDTIKEQTSHVSE